METNQFADRQASCFKRSHAIVSVLILSTIVVTGLRLRASYQSERAMEQSLAPDVNTAIEDEGYVLMMGYCPDAMVIYRWSEPKSIEAAARLLRCPWLDRTVRVIFGRFVAASHPIS
jgi:hypothetical protein